MVSNQREDEVGICCHVHDLLANIEMRNILEGEESLH